MQPKYICEIVAERSRREKSSVGRVLRLDEEMGSFEYSTCPGAVYEDLADGAVRARPALAVAHTANGLVEVPASDGETAGAAL